MTSNRSARKLQILPADYEEPLQLDLLSLFSEHAQPESAAKVKQPRASSNKALPAKNASYHFHGNVDETKTFSTLCLGKTNQFAIEAIKRFITSEKSDYGMIFLKAASGLGKSHILQAAANEMKTSKKSFYLSSPLMMSPIVDSFSILKFYDILLIDDIDEIEGNFELQKIFCQLIDFAQAGKIKLVITGRKLPKDLNEVDERMKGKLSASLIHHIDEMNTGLAYDIVEARSAYLNLNLPEAVKRLVSNQLGFNVYGLESLLYKFKNLVEIKDQKITIDVALEEIKDKAREEKSIYRSSETQELLASVAQSFNVTYQELISTIRKQEFALARHAAMYVLKHKKNMSVMKIAEVFEKDHSSVIYALARIEKLLEKDFEIKSKIQVLLTRV